MTATATPNQGQRRPNLPANANGASRPNLATARNEAPQNINDILKSPKTVERFKAIVPRHLSAERMLRVMALAVHKTPELAQANPITLLGAMMVLASLGIEPNTPLGHAYLIPFGKRKKVGDEWVTENVEVNVVLGYRGLIDLARRSGTLVSIHADIVYEGDEFSFEYGSNMHLRHIPIGAREGRKPLWAYAHAKLKDGEAFEVLPYDQVLAVRDGSEGYKSALRARDDAKKDAKKTYRLRAYETAPWVKYEHEMAAKTMIRRVSKKLPMSIEFANAARLDEMSEANAVNYDAFAALEDASTLDVEAAGREPEQIEHQDEQPLNTASGAGQQQQQQDYDPDTGEVVENRQQPQQQPRQQAQPAKPQAARNPAPAQQQAPQQQGNARPAQQARKPAPAQQAQQPQGDAPYAEDNRALTDGLPARSRAQQQQPQQPQQEPAAEEGGADQGYDDQQQDDGQYKD